MSVGPAPVHKPRLEALSDGVIAVVMTLLVLELKIEHLPPHPTSDQIWEALHDLKRPLFGYLVAFIWTAFFWFLHHQMLALLNRINARFVGFTLAFLLTISLLPFSVSLLMRTAAANAAGVVYYGNFTLVAVVLLASWTYARRIGLVDHPSVAATALTLRLVSMSVAGLAATLVSCFSYEIGTGVVLVILLIGGRLRRRFEANASRVAAASA